jgi:HK97 gp10 family phage protein
MPATGLTWSGIDALTSGLVGLAATWKQEAQQDAAAAASAHAAAISRVYQAHRRTGVLAASVSVTPITGGRVGAKVTADAPYARHFENGTRYMPPQGIFRDAGKSAAQAMLAAADRRVMAPVILR